MRRSSILRRVHVLFFTNEIKSIRHLPGTFYPKDHVRFSFQLRFPRKCHPSKDQVENQLCQFAALFTEITGLLCTSHVRRMSLQTVSNVDQEFLHLRLWVPLKRPIDDQYYLCNLIIRFFSLDERRRSRNKTQLLARRYSKY